MITALILLDNFSGAGWCWIGANYFYYRIFFHYGIRRLLHSSWYLVFLFFNLLALPILYLVLFFIIRRQTSKMRTLNSSNGLSANTYSSSAHDNLEMAKSVTASMTDSVENETFTVQPPFNSQPGQRAAIGTNESATKRMNSVSRTLLCYPIAYLCLIMPISIARIAEFTGAGVPIPVVFFACGFYASCGYVNVIVYTTTRKGIISWSWIAGLIGRKRNV